MPQNSVFEQDPHSYSEPEKVKVTGLYLQITPSFEKRQLSAIAELDLNWLTNDTDELILDTKKLDIKKIEALNGSGNWVSVDYNLDQDDPVLGSALHIQATPENKKIRITYETDPSANGLQWLEPSQTAGKEHPYVYSHSEPIGARSWIPLQDTPAVRFTYKATIYTPKTLRAVMSANNDPDHPLDGKFEFTMPQEIPSYLVAFAIGNIATKKTGPRSAVYSEPSVVGGAAKEFEDTEQMIQTSEKLYGPYRWDQYDILVLPPSFPMGGMENPRLTFATPTIIAGDKSLVNVVAHELAHSWSGNLVTNAAWRHIWLNEGFTTYVENRIIEAIYGEEEANQHLIVDFHRLQEEMASLPQPDQRLVPDLKDRDPREGFGSIVYFKGAWFLKTLEQHFGRETFDQFLREYFDRYAFQSNTTDTFSSFIEERLIQRYPEKYSMAQLNEWLHQPGIPKDAINIKSQRFPINDEIRSQWLNGEIKTSDLNAKTWSSNEWLHFLKHLPNKLTQEQLKSLDDTYHLTDTKNNVIATQWYKIAIANNYEQAKPSITNHLMHIGRRILVAPLYDEMLKNEAWHKDAQEIYQSARPAYHSLTREKIDKLFAASSLSIGTDSAQKREMNTEVKLSQSSQLTHFKPAPVSNLQTDQPDISQDKKARMN